MRLSGRAVAAAFRPVGSEVVEVHPISRPQSLPAGGRFLLDVHLGTLARRLRLLGIDTAYTPDADDDALAAEAVQSRRMLLTQDRGLLRRTALRETAAFVRGQGADDQLADVLDRFAPPLAPYTRCPRCNGLLHPVAKDDVRHLLAAGTERSYEEFRQCPGCSRVYWRGAHARRLHAIVTEAAGPVDE
jgi:uncharacterized protein